MLDQGTVFSVATNQDRPALDAAETVIVFPAAGSHWPGMCGDIDADPDGRVLVDRAEAALDSLGIPQGRLRALMAGDGQAQRTQSADGFDWTGDYPLSSVAQTVVSVALADRFIERHGAPVGLLGESMGELAAYCVAGCYSFEDAVQTTYRWARALQRSSETAGQLRLALLVMVKRDDLPNLCTGCGARVVIYESINQFVAALPRARIAALDQRVRDAGGGLILSVQPCGAHDPRLAMDDETWAEYDAWLNGLSFAMPNYDIYSVLEPGNSLRGESALRENLRATSTSTLHWGEAISRLFWMPESLMVSALVQVCSKKDAYVLQRLRPQGVVIQGVRIEAVGSLAGVDAL